jgi:hypothetical protein
LQFSWFDCQDITTPSASDHCYCQRTPWSNSTESSFNMFESQGCPSAWCWWCIPYPRVTYINLLHYSYHTAKCSHRQLLHRSNGTSSLYIK